MKESGFYDDERLDGRPPAENSRGSGRGSTLAVPIPTNLHEDV